MSEAVLHGLAAARGVAVGRALVLTDVPAPADGSGGPEAQEEAVASLERVREELVQAAAGLAAAGRAVEAEIFQANALMAGDPVLAEEVRILAAEKPAAAALLEATEHHAGVLASLSDSTLAARAADVRRLGRRAALVASGAADARRRDGPFVLLAADLGPADVLDLDLASGRILGIVLADGSATSHAAILARALGVPMVVGVGPELLAAEDGVEVVLDGDDGVVVLSPDIATRTAAGEVRHRQEREHSAFAATRELTPVTSDGRRIRLLCNVCTPAEAAAGAAAGAEGIGLLRTELAFVEAPAWPGEDEHEASLAPILAAFPGCLVTVRTLDFGGDKTPPFLAGTGERGLALTLAHPEALAAQLGGILRAGRGRDLRILLPLVSGADEVDSVRASLEERAKATGWEGDLPPLGAMIETPEAAAHAAEIAGAADFVSIGTNDLVQYTLGLDRALPLASALAAADPAILELVDAVVEAAHAAGRTVEVCGEAAGEPALVALLVGLGVDELSVSPTRLDEVRATVLGLSSEEAAATARRALAAGSAARALEAAEPLLDQLLDKPGQARDGLGGVLA
jgi:phosphoenolpyruvate-protein kinase (PTS system EI component)